MTAVNQWGAFGGANVGAPDASRWGAGSKWSGSQFMGADGSFQGGAVDNYGRFSNPDGQAAYEDYIGSGAFNTAQSAVNAAAPAQQYNNVTGSAGGAASFGAPARTGALTPPANTGGNMPPPRGTGAPPPNFVQTGLWNPGADGPRVAQPTNGGNMPFPRGTSSPGSGGSFGDQPMPRFTGSPDLMPPRLMDGPNADGTGGYGLPPGAMTGGNMSPQRGTSAPFPEMAQTGLWSPGNDGPRAVAPSGGHGSAPDAPTELMRTNSLSNGDMGQQSSLGGNMPMTNTGGQQPWQGTPGGGSSQQSLGSNPYMNAQADEIGRRTQQGLGGAFSQIRSNSVGSGNLGGSREGVAQGTAIGQAMDSQQGQLANLFGSQYNSDQNRDLTRYQTDMQTGLGMRGQDLSRYQGDQQIGLGARGQDLQRYGMDQNYASTYRGQDLQRYGMDQNFYTAQRGQDQSGAAIGADLYSRGINGEWDPLRNANASYGTYTGYGTTTNNSQSGGGWQGAAGGATAAAAFARQMGWI